MFSPQQNLAFLSFIRNFALKFGLNLIGNNLKYTI